MDVAFKLADVADIDLLVEFMREFYEFDHHAFDEPVARSALRKILSMDSGLIGSSGGEVSGFGLENPTAYLWRGENHIFG